MTRWFVDQDGKLNASIDGPGAEVSVPPNSMEVQTPPPSPHHRYIDGAWTTDAPLTAAALAVALQKKGVLSKAEIDTEKGKP